MKKKSNTSLSQSLLHAVLSYDSTCNEEQGGFILKEIGKENYTFALVKNQLAGTAEACGLYLADDDEFGALQIKTVDEDQDIFASFHTHPIGMRAIPSIRDVEQLFTSFPVNYIYAYDKELNRFDFDRVAAGNVHKNWKCTNVMTFNGFKFLPSRPLTREFIDVESIVNAIPDEELLAFANRMMKPGVLQLILT